MINTIIINLLSILVALVTAVPSEYRVIADDLIVAYVAQAKAGDPIPFETDYTKSDVFEEYGMATNSTWLTDTTRVVVPFMAYEGVSPRGIYPKVVLFLPEANTRSLHIAGSTVPSKLTVRINERYLLDPRWNDERRALATLVHELIHDQGGNFSIGNGEKRESFTQAATIEVLAAMCNYGDDVACYAFWDDVKNYSLSSVRVALHDLGHDNAYDTLYDLFFSPDGDDAYQKSKRFWSKDESTYWYIKRAYGARPYYLLRMGVYGETLPTGHLSFEPYNGAVQRVIGKVEFDDTRALLGWLGVLVR